jgi:transcriptional regulator with XRE-family HTH domain
MDQSATNQFRAALTYLLDQEGRGAQTRLADLLGIDRGYLSAIIRGRKPGSEAKRCQIAAHFGMVYEDMLVLGRRIINGDDDPSRKGQAEDTPPSQEGIDTDAEENRVIDFKTSPINESGPGDVSKKIITLLQMLNSDTVYAGILDGLLDSYQESVSTDQKIQQLEKENLALRNEIKEMKSRLDKLESRPDSEKESLRKTA